ncbi:hypothetical protein Leryth_005809, partial [Lithospermum erythrorhizon]
SSPDLPPHYHTTNGLPPNHFYPLFDALQNAGTVFSEILKSLQPDLVIYDICQTWLPPIAASYDIPSVFFQTTGAATCSHLLHPLKRPDLEYPFSAIFLRDMKRTYEDARNGRFLSCIEQSNEIVLIRSSRAFEEKYIDFQSVVVDKKMVSLGLLVIIEPEDDLDDDSEIIQWLNGKKEASTVYVSFGSEIILTKDEVKEIALGLEMSNVNFIWVLRSPHGEKTSLEEVMPDGFLGRIEGKGFIEEVWAPQAKILKHPSIGVPIIAMPMQYDQPVNARLVAEMGIGLEFVRDEKGQTKGEDLARVIKEVMFKDEGKAIFRKSREVRVKSKEEVDIAA